MTPDTDSQDDPLGGIGGAISKFVCAAVFGGFVSVVVFLGVLWLGWGDETGMDRFWNSPWPHILWIIPLVWGFLGVFWFDRMLDASRDIFDRFFGVNDDD